MASFPSTRSQNILSWPLFVKNKTGQNIKFFTKNHGLTPWKNTKFSSFLNGCFSNLKWLSYYLEVHKTLCMVFFCWKTNKDKISNFWPTTMEQKTNFTLVSFTSVFFCICIKFALFAWMKGSEVVSATRWWLMTKCKGPTNEN